MNHFHCRHCLSPLASCYCSETDAHNERPNAVWAEEDERAARADELAGNEGMLTRRQAE